MCKEKTLPNNSVVNKNLIRKIETVTDAIFEQYDGLLLGFLIEKGCWFSNMQISPSDSAMAIISAKTAIALTSDYNVIHKTMDNIDILYGTQIITSEGRYLGILIDFYFDEYPKLTKENQSIHDFFLSTEKSLLSTAMPSLIEEQIIGLQTIIQNTDPKFLIPKKKLKGRAMRMPTKSSLLQNTAHIKMLLNCTMQKSFVLHQIAQQTVDVPDYGYLIQENKLLTPQSSNVAEYLEVFDELYLSADGKSVQELGDHISLIAELIVEQVPITIYHQKFGRVKIKESDLLPVVNLSIRRQLPIQNLGKYKSCLLLTK